jgi:hypothetical protein
LRKSVLALPIFLAGYLAASAAAADEAEVRSFVKAYLTEAAGGSIGPTSLAVAFFDLNADGTDEAIVYVVGSYWCGSGGCDALVLTPSSEGFEVVMDASVTRTPIGVLETATNGWRDIFVTIGGGGGQAGAVVMKFDGQSYPGNPTAPPAEPTDATAATVLFGEDVVGIPLD